MKNTFLLTGILGLLLTLLIHILLTIISNVKFEYMFTFLYCMDRFPIHWYWSDYKSKT